MRKAIIVLILGFGQIVAFASSYYGMGVLADPMARDLALNPSLIFGLMSASFLISALTAAPVGRWLDARGGREVLLISSLAFAAALALLAAADGPEMIVAGMLLMGAAMAIGLYESAFVILVSLYGDAARRPITGVALLGGLGSSIGWPATLWLQQTYGWRGACLGWAGVHLLVCLPFVLFFIPKTGGRGHAPAAPRPKGLWDRRMIQLAALFACAWFVSTCMSAHLPRLLVKLGLTPRAAVATAALVGLAAVSARLLEFTVLRRLPPLTTTRVATLMHPLGAAITFIFGPRAAAALALGQGAGNGMLTVAKGVLPLTVFGPENYGYRSGLLSMPARFCQAGGPLIYGLILDRSAAWALMTSGGVCLVMFALSFGLNMTRHVAPEPALTSADAG